MIRILHVDDDLDHLTITRRQLKELCAEIDIESTTNTAACLESIRNRDFDCVICDYRMPGVDGLELLNILISAGKKTPFILYTGRGSPELKTRALEAGAALYYTKETNHEHFERLLNGIKSVVDRSGQGSSSSGKTEIITEHCEAPLVESRVKNPRFIPGDND